MKILAISASYPPYHNGGYEIRIKNILDGLNKRGHRILVLTTTINKISRKTSSDKHDYPVNRLLVGNHQKNDLLSWMTTHRITHGLGLLLIFLRELSTDLKDIKTIDSIISEARPDIVYLGYILPLTRTLLPFLAETHTPAILDDGGATLVILKENKGIWYRFLEEYYRRFEVFDIFKPMMRKIISLLSNRRIKPRWIWPQNLTVLFRREENKKAAERAGIPIPDAKILLSAVNEKEFSFMPRTNIQSPVRIIIPSRIEPRKGQIDAIRLVKVLSMEGIPAKLYLIGEPRKSFLPDVSNEISKLGISNHVKLIPMITQHELVSWYQNSDICFFSSYWKDGLSRVPLEAMACGSIIISYGNEGSSEIIQNRENGFLVHSEDYPTIIGIIKELIMNPEMVEKITTKARLDIEINYSMNLYIDRIEKVLYEVTKQPVNIHDNSKNIGNSPLAQ